MTKVASDQRRANARATRKSLAAERKRLAREAKKRADEEKAERVAPKVQREPILGRNGEVIRGARLEVDGLYCRKSNPIRRMRKMNEQKDAPLITKAHETASERLLLAWYHAETISSGTSNYGEYSPGSSDCGIIADRVLSMVNEQISARREVQMVSAHLGALWPIIHAVIIRGIGPSAWGEACGMAPNVSTGYLAAALDKLVEVYTPKRDRPQRIRSAEVRGVVIDEITTSV